MTQSDRFTNAFLNFVIGSRIYSRRYPNAAGVVLLNSCQPVPGTAMIALQELPATENRSTVLRTRNGPYQNRMVVRYPNLQKSIIRRHGISMYQCVQHRFLFFEYNNFDSIEERRGYPHCWNPIHVIEVAHRLGAEDERRLPIHQGPY